MPLNMQFLYLT